jgi:hypothetical protein
MVANQNTSRIWVGSAPRSRATAATAVSTSSSVLVGRTRRALRSISQPAESPPRARSRVREAALAYPPTRKKTGITWASQVSGYAQRRSPSAECPVACPAASRPITVTLQCPKTTMVMASARSRSTYRSRPAGVRSANWRRRRIAQG